MEYAENAYAKVNLHLEILNRRADGYHNIFSLMLSAEESDLLKLDSMDVSDQGGPIEVDITPSGGRYEWLLATIPAHENLITAAVKAYFRKAGKSCRIALSVEKNIPAGAGLGGGSSDAAAMLRLLNSQLALYGEEELIRMASALGADVPYCLLGGCALCEGIGEKITRLEGALDYWVLIACSGVMVNTGRAYAALNRTPEYRFDGGVLEEKKRKFTEGIGSNELGRFRDILKNDFETVVFKDHPELEKIKAGMIQHGADYAAMTGSGSSIIGLFKDYNAAREAERKMKGGVQHLIVSRII